MQNLNLKFIKYMVLGLLLLAISVGIHSHTASAHEVYVLHQNEIESGVTVTSPNPFTAIPDNEKLFITYGVGILILVLLVLTMSVSRTFEKVFDPFLLKLKRYAPLIARITLGSSLIISGYYRALFGPELELAQIFGQHYGEAVSFILMVAGLFILVGIFTRFSVLVTALIYMYAIGQYGLYMLNYANYFGEMVLFFILGAGIVSFDDHFSILRKGEEEFTRMKKRMEPYSFLILRVLYGLAIFFASFYAKFLHSNLALKTVADYHLTNYFPFTPLFLVLGAFLVEATVGICIAIGFEIRFVTLVFTFFLTISIMFFGESVWPHLVLFGINAVLFCHGYDKYTFEKAVLERHRKGEPVL